MILQTAPDVLNDSAIDLNELKRIAAVEVVQLFEMNDGKFIVDKDGFAIPTQNGQKYLDEADEYLETKLVKKSFTKFLM